MDIVKDEGEKRSEDTCVDDNAISNCSVSKDIEIIPEGQTESNDASISSETQMELDSGRRIISEIIKQNKTTCWPFMEVVDAEGLGLWDYPSKIKEPMWLNKILEKFDNKQYSSFAEFAKDFRIMVENCYRYNTTEHPISKKAKRLEMLFEGKLALLKRGIRENATIAKTSNGRFATLADEGNPTMRSGRISIPANGANREADSESQGRLVYDFVRCEEATLAEDERQASYRERKQQQTLYQQFAAAFVSSLESREDAKRIKRCHYLPEIGLFLHLNESTLRLPPLAMYNLEMSLLIPSDSLYLAKIMTSFLCTYFERSLISQRNPMTFKTWERRLKQRLEKWYETVCKYNSYLYAADKLCIGVDFFHLMKWKNPFISDDGAEKSFLDFSYDEKAALIKAVCDNMTTFQSVQNNIASLPCEQSRVMTLGYDVAGNEYTYFPQFCGDDVRVYRHRQYGDLPAFDPPEPAAALKNHKDNVHDDSKSKEDVDGSRVSDSELSKDEAPQDVEMKTELVESDSKSLDVSETTLPMSETCGGQSIERSGQTAGGEDILPVSDEVKNASPRLQRSCLSPGDSKCNGNSACESLRAFGNGENVVTGSEQCYLDTDSQESIDKTELDVTSEASYFNTTDVAQSRNVVSTSTVSNANQHCKQDTVTDQCVSKNEPSSSVEKSEAKNIASNIERLKNSLVKSKSTKKECNNFAPSPTANSSSQSEDNYQPFYEQQTPKSSRKRLHKKKISEEPASSPLRRSSRKRNAVNYTSMLVPSDPVGFPSPEPDNVGSVVPTKKPKQKRNKKQKHSKRTATIVKVEEPEEEYGSVDFELVCDGLGSLRQLITAIEQEHQDAIKDKKPPIVINNVASLLEKLEWLVGELRSFETHLEKARFDARIQLKREHDMIFRDATTGKAIHSTSPDVDPWEDEILSKNTMLQGENTSTYSTPPASIYLEESDEESDREIRRSKRRPKRYESDEDFVLDSAENSPSYQVSTTFMYDEFDEDRLRLIPAALDELEERLQKQAQVLQKMMGGGRVTRQSEFKEANQLLTNERRTRQRSKKENKVFRKVLMLALKEKGEFGPSLLPLLRSDQTEIGEVVERVLEKEVIARQQRRLAREEEQRRKRTFKQAVQQKTKAARATHRAASKLVAKYKQERHDPKSDAQQPVLSKVASPSTMFSPPKKNTTIPNIQTSSNPNHVLTTDKTENVMIRLQNGKICQALKFSDGRVVPIVRMGNTTKASTFENLTQRTGVLKKVGNKTQVHPHISLTSRKTAGVSILKQQPAPNKHIFSNTITCPGSSTSTGMQRVGTKSNAASPIVNCASKLLTNVPEQLQPTGPPAMAQPRKIAQYPRSVMSTGRTVLSPTGVSQRLTLPSGQVINLLVKNQPETALKPAPTQSLGKMFVDNINNMESSMMTPHPTAPVVQSTPSIVLSRPIHNPPSEVPPLSDTVNTSFPGQLGDNVTSIGNKPLGVVAPMQVRQPSSMSNVDRARQNPVQYSASQTAVRYPTTPQGNFVSPVIAAPGRPVYQEGHPVVGAQETSTVHFPASQQSYLGMQNVALVQQPVYHRQQTAHPVQLVPTMMAASVPLVHPVQYVQTVPIPVQAPLMFVAPGQAALQIGGVDSSQYMRSTAAASVTPAQETITTPSPQQRDQDVYTGEK